MRADNEANKPLRVLRAFSVAKRPDAPNEDRWCTSEDGAICALSDGASVSFDPAPWAEALTRRFVHDQNITRNWLDDVTAEYCGAYDRETMPWMHQAAFDRGSFATLLGVVVSPDSQAARVFTIGDTLLALIDGGDAVRTIPYVTAAEFEHSPKLISTSMFENRLLDDEELSDAWDDIAIGDCSAPILLLLTDAIGRWLLDEPSRDRISELLKLDDEQSFTAFVMRERSEGRLKRDDTTMIVMGVPPP